MSRQAATVALAWLRAEATAGRLPDVHVTELPINTRGRQTIIWAGCQTVRDLLAADDLAFYRQPGCGVGTLDRIRRMREVLHSLMEGDQ